MWSLMACPANKRGKGDRITYKDENPSPSIRPHNSGHKADALQVHISIYCTVLKVISGRHLRMPGCHQRTQPKLQQRKTARYEIGALFSCTTSRSSTQHRGRGQTQLFPRLGLTESSKSKTTVDQLVTHRHPRKSEPRRNQRDHAQHRGGSPRYPTRW